MKLEFSTLELLRRFLPNHKRQDNRVALFWWPLKQIYLIWLTFRVWRDTQIYNVKLVPQTMVVEAVLNNQVSNSGNAISIVQSEDGAIYFGLLSEDTDSHYMSTEAENSDDVEVPLYGEGSSALTVNFKVYAPAACNPAEIVAILDKYVLAGYTYEIIQN